MDSTFGLSSVRVNELQFLDSLIDAVQGDPNAQAQIQELKRLSTSAKAELLGTDRSKARNAAKELLREYFSK